MEVEVYTDNDYEEFINSLESKYPKLFPEYYGGVITGPGWWRIVEELCKNIQTYVDWNNTTRELLLKNNPYDIKIPEQLQQPSIVQIKEKFGGLRFYCDNTDDKIRGMIDMAEAWAANSCEQCGKPGKIRSNGGWITTLCDDHEEERQKAMKK